MHHIILALLGILFTLAHANVEKTIFLAPPTTTIPSSAPDLDDLGLERLSPENAVVRTQLNASFPTAEAPAGTDSWFFLENLTPGQRYEVRICWLATVRPQNSLQLNRIRDKCSKLFLMPSPATNIIHPLNPHPPPHSRRPNPPLLTQHILHHPSRQLN